MRPCEKQEKVCSVAILERCGNNWKNGKGGCGPLLHIEYAPTIPTVFLPFVIQAERKSNKDKERKPCC